MKLNKHSFFTVVKRLLVLFISLLLFAFQEEMSILFCEINFSKEVRLILQSDSYSAKYRTTQVQVSNQYSCRDKCHRLTVTCFFTQ